MVLKVVACVAGVACVAFVYYGVKAVDVHVQGVSEVPFSFDGH